MSKALLGASILFGWVLLLRPVSGRLEIETKVNTWLTTALRWVSGREGQPHSLNRNLDGNGLSYGVIQWTQKSGNLGVVLDAMQAADPIAFARVFGASAMQMLEVARRGSLEKVDGAHLWEDPWASRFKTAGKLPIFMDVQWRLAASGEHMAGARTVAALLGVHTERAMTLFFDRAVHQGANGVKKIAEKLAVFWEKRGKPSYAKILETFAWMCAERYRRKTAPDSPYFSKNSTQVIWKKVGQEWRAYTGEFDLYAIVVKRTEEILKSLELSDESMAEVRG